ncbi:MAG: S8 family serine peptidase [Acidobacteria bacterium]|nr:S8 family serine peptidase [Acidobacteriota bacterium]
MRQRSRTEGRRLPGRGVCVAVIDSGVHAAHPHVRGVAGGVAIQPGGAVSGDYTDRIGHGTAVMAAIKEKAPFADCYAVRIFDNRLSASAPTLIAAIDWAVAARVHVINLSLGTANLAHADAFDGAVARAAAAGVTIVAARDDEGVEWLPGSRPGVVGVRADWTCGRDVFTVERLDSGSVVFRTSGYARPIPGVDPRRNLHGVSFAVANMTGFLARALSLEPDGQAADAVETLVRFASWRDGRAHEKEKAGRWEHLPASMVLRER